MNDHNLDDLIIGEPTQATNKSKSILAIIALIVIILLVGILLSKMILESPEDDIILPDNNQTEFVSPDLIPVVNDDKESNDELTPIKKEELPEPEPKEKPKKKIEKPKPKPTPKKEEPKKIEEPIKPKPVKPKPVKPKPIKKEPIKEQVKKPVKKPAKPSELFSKNKSVYYVQVGAFNKDPNPKYLKKIKDAGFNYIINKNEKTRRVRVGPYGSYAEAKTAVSDINSSIGTAGFVIKSKK